MKYASPVAIYVVLVFFYYGFLLFLQRHPLELILCVFRLYKQCYLNSCRVHCEIYILCIY